jgi:SagB-type dehydrogenase family enzyme
MASFSERYHEYTKYHPETIGKLGPVDWNSQPPLFKEWDTSRAISLLPWLQVLKGEASTRDFAQEQPELPPLNETEFLASALYYTSGITSLSEHQGQYFYFRANPSAGGLYPIEVYLAVRNSKTLPEGVYAFHPLLNALIPVENTSWKQVASAFFDEECIRSADVVMIYTGRIQRGSWRYRDRAYRRILLDCGHAFGNTQSFMNFHKIPHALHASYNDEELAQALHLPIDTEPPLMALAWRADAHSLAQAPQLRSPLPQDAVTRTKPGQCMIAKQNTVERICSWYPAPPTPQSQDFPLDVVFDTDFDLPTELWVQAIKERRSCREFAAEALSIDQLGLILRSAYGDAEHLPSVHLNTWIIVRNIEGISPGIYQICPEGKGLHRTQDFFDWEPFFLACLSQDIAKNCAALLLHTANLDRATSWLGDRAYRYLTLEAGRLGERLNLAALLVGAGFSGVGGYYDDLINELLDMERTEAILYVSCLGECD